VEAARSHLRMQTGPSLRGTALLETHLRARGGILSRRHPSFLQASQATGRRSGGRTGRSTAPRSMRPVIALTDDSQGAPWGAPTGPVKFLYPCVRIAGKVCSVGGGRIWKEGTQEPRHRGPGEEEGRKHDRRPGFTNPRAPNWQFIPLTKGQEPVRADRSGPGPFGPPTRRLANPSAGSTQQERQLLLFAEPRLSSRRMVETKGGTRCTGPLAMSAVVWPVLAMAVTSAPFSTR